MSKLADIVVSLTLDSTEFMKGINEASDSIKNVGRDFEKAGTNISKNMSKAFDDMSDGMKFTQKELRRLGNQTNRLSKLTQDDFNKLPDHLKPYAKQLKTLQKAFRETQQTAVGSLDEIREAVIKTRVGFDKMTSISDTGRQAVAVLNDLREASKEAQLAVLGFNADGTEIIDTDEAIQSLKRFEDAIDEAVDKLEELREQGDFGSYIEGMRALEHETRLVENAMSAATKGGQSFLSALARLGIITSSMGNATAVAMERMKEGAILANERLQAMETQAQKITKVIKDFDGYPLAAQFLKIGDHMERTARQGTALNLALQQLGKNAPFKDIQDRVRFINSGLMRMQALQAGMAVAVGVTTLGLIALSNEIDGRLIPAFENFKSTWADALEPFVNAFTTALVAVINFGTWIGSLAKKFAEVHPQLSQMLWGFIYLTMVLTLLLSPLAVGIGLTGGLAAAFNLLWAAIAPFVLGFLTVVGTAMLLAAAIVTLTAAINNMWKYSEGFRKAVTGLWDGIKSAWLSAMQPVIQKWNELKMKFMELLGVLTGGQAKSMGDFWKWFGNIVGTVINTIAKVLLPAFQLAFTIAGQVIAGVLDVLIFVFGMLANAWKQHGGQITQVVGIIWNYIVLAFTTVGNFIKSIMPQVVSTITMAFDLIKQVISFAAPYIKAIVVGAFQAIAAVIQFLMPFIQAIVVSAWQNIKNMVVSAVQIIQNVIKLFSNILKGNWSAAWENVKAILVNIVTFIWNYVNLVLIGRVVKLFSTFGKTALNLVKSAFTGIANIVKSLLTSAWNIVHSLWTKMVSTIKTACTVITVAVSTGFGKVVDGIREKLNSALSKAKSIFNDIKSAMTKPIESAKSTILGIIDSIKSAFSRMKISIPKPKLPKINVGSKSFLGGKVTIPTFSISWHAKGAIFNQPTLFGSGHGVGEAGGEVVMPIEHKRYMTPYAKLVAGLLPKYMKQGGAGGNEYHINFNQPVYIREEADIKKLADEIEKRQRVAERAKGIFSYA